MIEFDLFKCKCVSLICLSWLLLKFNQYIDWIHFRFHQDLLQNMCDFWLQQLLGSKWGFFFFKESTVHWLKYISKQDFIWSACSCLDTRNRVIQALSQLFQYFVSKQEYMDQRISHFLCILHSGWILH